MPPLLIGAVVASTLGAGAGTIGGTAIIGGLTIGGLVTSIGSLALTFGLQMLLAPKPKKSTRSEQVSARDSNPQRLRICGRTKLGGSTFLLEAINGAYLYTGTVHCEGQVDAIEQWWLNDTLTAKPASSVDGFSSAGVAPWQSAVIIDSHMGSDTQAASPFMGPLAPLGWTTAHQLKGLCYSIVWCVLPPKPDKNFQNVFPSGAPSLRVVLRAPPILDPRTNVTAWSRNPSLIIRDFLTYTRTDGVSGRSWSFIPAGRIDEDSFKAFADVCDEAIPLKGGGTEPRYCMDGSYDLNEEPRDVLRRMLDTCDAELFQTPEGKVAIRGGEWEEPTVTLTESMFIALTYTQGNDKYSAFNRLKFTFVDVANDYQSIDGDPWDDDESQIDRGEVLIESVDLPMVQSHPQGRRICKIRTAKANPRHHLSDCTVQLPALALLGERVVRVQIPTLSLDTVFAITKFAPSDDLSTVNLDLSSFDASAYEWDPDTEEGVPPSAAASGADPDPAPDPADVELSVDKSASVYEGFLVRVRVTADALTGTYASYYNLEGQIRQSGIMDWTPMSPETTTNTVVSDYLTDGLTYEVQVRYSGLGKASNWSATHTITATSDDSPPGTPSGFVANGGSGQVMLAWTAPASFNTYSTRLYRKTGTSTDFSTATLIRTVYLGPNQAFDMVDPSLASGAYTYWVEARNGSGVPSATPAGPMTATVT